MHVASAGFCCVLYMYYSVCECVQVGTYMIVHVSYYFNFRTFNPTTLGESQRFRVVKQCLPDLHY